MSGLMIMLPVSVIIALGFLAFYFWSLRNGDIKNADNRKYHILLEDEDDIDTNMKK